MSGALIIFDGYCNLCSGLVQFILRHDTKKHFRFVAGQSKEGLSLLKQHHLNTPETIVLLSDNKIYHSSDAVLEIIKHLPCPWRFLLFLKIVPRFIRNPVYQMVARNRYQWFGKRKTCAANIG